MIGLLKDNINYSNKMKRKLSLAHLERQQLAEVKVRCENCRETPNTQSILEELKDKL